MEKQRIEELQNSAPAIRDIDRDAVNGLFRAYIFRRAKTREIWTSCCRQHTELPAGHPLLSAPHVKEPTAIRWGCSVGCWGAPSPKPAPEATYCPLCGKLAEVKELGRSGKRINLWSYRRVVVMRKQEGVLWALAYEAVKNYKELTDYPFLFLVGIYRFDGKRAEYIGRGNWEDCSWFRSGELDAGPLPRRWAFGEPFNWCREYGNDYDVIDLDGEDGTPYAYCGFSDCDFTSLQMKFLALCTAYPRQVEMLMKAGLTQIIKDRINGTLNAALFDWNDPNPFRSFAVPKDVLRTWLAGDKRAEVMTAYKQFQKAKLPLTLEQAESLYQTFGPHYFNRLTIRMKRYAVGYERMRNYLERQRKPKGRKKAVDLLTAAGWWCDYVDAAAKLGLDLKNPVFLLPRELLKSHDEKTAAAAALAEKTAGRSRVKTLTKKYTFWDSRWLIRPPISSAEIVAEGEALKHCVGGYADRHAKGKTTILFLRDKLRPGRPLVTIEMRGSEIVQIHGFRNEAAACRANPRKLPIRTLYREFLDSWLAWLQDGSKRDKQGKPVLPVVMEVSA